MQSTGKPLIPAMRKRGYKGSYAAAVIAAGALLGPIIPPSIPMVVYAQIANVSVIRMFLAGIVPGLMLAAGFFALCTVIARRRGYPAEQRTNFAGKVRATGRASWALAMPILIILGIRAGLFTETEVAAAVVLYALFVSLVVYRDMKAGELPSLILEAGRSSAVILFLLAAAGPFSWLVAETQVSEHLVAGIRTISDHPVAILLIVNLLLLVVGSLLEPLPAMVIFLPALLPIVPQLGIDPIHFGAVVVINLMIGMLHPPVGLLNFVVATISGERVTSVAWESLAFLGWALVVLFLIVVFPPLTTWLPNTVR
jgi:tripartite ATP-independent transporter DctM subunit